ncbi:unnamed protein product [Ranitomeya imitator]|uniref:Uncharacterized protein n=1 Tax=Ranitomeya imitator TaxID=111125 RepID=A0ABN9MNX2_9NEOB|nr:unnamed protein product [Ranitomeya imitator]
MRALLPPASVPSDALQNYPDDLGYVHTSVVRRCVGDATHNAPKNTCKRTQKRCVFRRTSAQHNEWCDVRDEWCDACYEWCDARYEWWCDIRDEWCDACYQWCDVRDEWCDVWDEWCDACYEWCDACYEWCDARDEWCDACYEWCEARYARLHGPRLIPLNARSISQWAIHYTDNTGLRHQIHQTSAQRNEWCDACYEWCDARYEWCDARDEWCDACHEWWCDVRDEWCDACYEWCDVRDEWCDVWDEWYDACYEWCDACYEWCDARYEWCDARDEWWDVRDEWCDACYEWCDARYEWWCDVWDEWCDARYEWCDARYEWRDARYRSSVGGLFSLHPGIIPLDVEDFSSFCRIVPLVKDSSAFAFTAFAGVPALEFSFLENLQPYKYLDTKQDTYESLDQVTNGRLPTVALSVAEVAGLSLIKLSHDHILPLDYTAYNDVLLKHLVKLQGYQKKLKSRGLTLDWLYSARGDYTRATQRLKKTISQSDIHNERVIQFFNVRIMRGGCIVRVIIVCGSTMRVEFYFLSQYVSAISSPYRHILLGRGEHTLEALMEHLGQDKDTINDNELRKQIALFTWTLEGAANALSGEVWEVQRSF